MPKGSWLFVPFNCEMIAGPPADLSAVAAEAIPGHLRGQIEALARQTTLSRWDLERGMGSGREAEHVRRPSGTHGRCIR
jgi:hypothetical protein